MKYVTKKELTPAIVWYILKQKLGKDFDINMSLLSYSMSDIELINICIRSNEWDNIIELIKTRLISLSEDLHSARFEQDTSYNRIIKFDIRYYKKLLSVILTKIVELENQDLIDRIEDLEIEIKSLKKEINILRGKK